MVHRMHFSSDAEVIWPLLWGAPPRVLSGPLAEYIDASHLPDDEQDARSKCKKSYMAARFMCFTGHWAPRPESVPSVLKASPLLFPESRSFTHSDNP